MQVILLTDVKKVGQRGTVITVADGYAMNVLFPKKLATPATPENLKKIDLEVKQILKNAYDDAEAIINNHGGKLNKIADALIEKETLALKGKRDMSAALARKALDDINGKTISMQVKSNDAGGLFESIREKHILEAITKATGISLPDFAVVLSEPIKKTGTYDVPVILHGVTVKVILEVLS